jgi:hypothetical protein
MDHITWGLGRTDSLIAQAVKILKLVIYLFLEFWPQIWFQKYHVSPIGTLFLINKDKNRGMFLFTFPHPSSNEGNVGVSSPLGVLGSIVHTTLSHNKGLFTVVTKGRDQSFSCIVIGGKVEASPSSLYIVKSDQGLQWMKKWHGILHVLKWIRFHGHP